MLVSKKWKNGVQLTLPNQKKHLHIWLFSVFFLPLCQSCSCPFSLHFQFLWRRPSTLLSIQGPLAESLQQSPYAAAGGREASLNQSAPTTVFSLSLFPYSLFTHMHTHTHTLSLYFLIKCCFLLLLLLPLLLARLSFLSCQRDLQLFLAL